MPTLHLSGDVESFDWWVTGLQNDWSEAGYECLGLTATSFSRDSAGLADEPAGTFTYMYPEKASNPGVKTTQHETKSGISPGRHTYYCWALPGNGRYYYVDSGSVTVQSPAPVYTMTVSVSGSTVTVKVDGVSSGDNVEIYGRYYHKSGVKAFGDSDTAKGSSFSATYENVKGGAYIVNFQVNSGGFASDTSKNVGVKWSWRHTVAKGEPIAMKASEWNDFADCAMSCYRYSNGSNMTVKTVSGKDQISADVTNSAIDAINGSGKFGMKHVGEGDPIYASTFQELRDNANSVISGL